MNKHLPLVVTAAAVALLTGHQVRCQAPANATQLNQGSGGASLQLLQTGDVVHAFAPPVAYHSRSSDGGRTWAIIEQSLGPMRLDAFAQDGDLMAGCGSAFGPAGVGGPAVSVSNDLGQTWSPALITTWTLPSFDAQTQVHVTGQTIVLVWTEPGDGSVWTRRSTDGGLTWPGPNVLLDQEPPPPFVTDSMDLCVIGDGPTVHVFWRPRTASLAFSPRMQTSNDAGLTWFPVARPTVPATFNGNTVVAGDANTLLLSDGGGPLHRSTDGGVTWTPVPGLAAGAVRDIAVDGSTVLVVVSSVSVSPQVWTIEVSTDGGQTWPNPPFVDSSTYGFDASAHVVGNDLYVDFVHETQPAWSMLAHSRDAGLTWTAMQFGVSGFSAGPRRNIHLYRELSAVPLLPSDIYAYVGLGWSILGSGTPGTGGDVPQLRLQGMPHAGEITDFTVENARGGAVGVLGITLEPPLSTPFAGGNLWLQPPWLLSAFVTGGAAGGAGVGAWSLPFAVPNNVALVGARLTGQAVVLDPAAAAGFALTHGIEVWMR